jgi:cell shape-determining protein MreC
MQYLQKTKRNNQNGKSFLIFLIFLIIFLGLFLLFPKVSADKVNLLGKPFWNLKWSVFRDVKEMSQMLSSKSSLVVKNNELEQENLELKNSLLRLKLLEKESEELKNILDRNEDESRILARIISKGIGTPYGTFIIDLGKEKINKGQEVYSVDGVLVGIVDEVYQNTSKIILLSAPGKKYRVEVGEESIPALAEGLGGGNFEIRIPRGVDVSVGDEIISPGLSVKLLGIIEHIDSRPQNSYQKILFKSPINANQMKWVLIKND